MTIEKAVETALEAARATGAEGKPFPLMDGITADMSIDDARLLAHAFALKRCARGPDDLIDLVTEIVTLMAAQWQAGARRKRR